MLLSGIGIALPRIFHIVVGASAGQAFLPMHIAVLIATLTFGILSGGIVASFSVLFSFLLTGMPSVERLPFMMIELMIYTIVLGLLNKKFNSYVSLIGAMIIGRILYAGVLLIASSLMGINTAMLNVWNAFVVGIYGILIQLAFVPIIAKYIKKGVKLDE